MTGTAEIYHLKHVADFAGVYAAAGAGGVIGTKGGDTSVMKNDKGVVIRFHTHNRGVEVNLDVSGVAIALAPT